MPPKRKQPVRLVEDDIDTSEFVAVHRVRQTGRDGRSTGMKMVQEPVYDPVSKLPVVMSETDIPLIIGEDSTMSDMTGVETSDEPVMSRKPTKVREQPPSLLVKLNDSEQLQHQRDYIQQFMDRIDPILVAMMSQECIKESERKCSNCDQNNWAIWRCADCILSMPMYRQCMRSTHFTTSFHRLECWTGTHFWCAKLSEVGGYILLRHRDGLPICETLRFYADNIEHAEREADCREQLQCQRQFQSAEYQTWGNLNLQNASTQGGMGSAWDDADDQMNADAEEQANAALDAFLESLQERPDAELEEPDDDVELIDHELDADNIRPYLVGIQDVANYAFNSTYIRVIHTNSIHEIGMVSCSCRGEESVPLDLIASHLIPTSFQRVRTVFTATLLDAFRLLSLELKATAYQYFCLLHRYTEPMNPASVVDLYNVFRRMSRLWRWMKKLKWGGFAGHNLRSALDVKPMELANFCPACLQIGINVAPNWEMDPNRFVYKRILVADRNFKADHVCQKKPSSDVWLSEGGGFVPPREDYFRFLRTAMETSTKAPCETTFQAITNSLLASKACDVTGVVGVACARHGCYAPNSLCDLFRGEQQKNVDYAFLAAIYGTKVHPNQGVMLLYDIICQYIVHLYQHIGGQLPENLKVIPGIGMFHVHAHKDECFFRYAPSLTKGAGCVCGEILESLWSALNTISPSVRTATLAHRAEMLDDHTSDSNHKKLLGEMLSLR